MSDPLAPGDRIECVDVEGFELPRSANRPSLGGIYTVREITDEGMGLSLVEVVNRPRLLQNLRGAIEFTEFTWLIKRFRHLRSDQHSIEVFRRIDVDMFGKVSA